MNNSLGTTNKHKSARIPGYSIKFPRCKNIRTTSEYRSRTIHLCVIFGRPIEPPKTRNISNQAKVRVISLVVVFWPLHTCTCITPPKIPLTPGIYHISCFLPQISMPARTSVVCRLPISPRLPTVESWGWEARRSCWRVHRRVGGQAEVERRSNAESGWWGRRGGAMMRDLPKRWLPNRYFSLVFGSSAFFGI